MEEIQTGDIVTLKSGSPPMVVTYVNGNVCDVLMLRGVHKPLEDSFTQPCLVRVASPQPSTIEIGDCVCLDGAHSVSMTVNNVSGDFAECAWFGEVGFLAVDLPVRALKKTQATNGPVHTI